MAGADQHAAWTGDDGEDVAGLDDVFGARIARYGDFDGAGPVLRRNAGGDAFGRFDRNGERGAVRAVVGARHRRQTDLLGAGLGDRQADQAARMRDHEVDRFGRDVFGRQDEVALIFAGSQGYLDGIEVSKIREFEKSLYLSLDDEGKTLDAIRDSKDLTDDSKAGLKKMIEKGMKMF